MPASQQLLLLLWTQIDGALHMQKQSRLMSFHALTCKCNMTAYFWGRTPNIATVEAMKAAADKRYRSHNAFASINCKYMCNWNIHAASISAARKAKIYNEPNERSAQLQ